MRTKSTRTFASISTFETDRFEWDRTQTGLGIRYRTGRNPAWHFQTRIMGRTVRRALGAVDALSCANAIFAAQTLKDQLTGQARAPVPIPDAPAISLAEFATRFLRDGTPNWKPATLRAHRHALSRFILSAFGPCALSSLNASDVAVWWAGMQGSAGTRNRTLAVLSGLIRHAELLGLRTPGCNPCRGLRLRKASFKAYRLTVEEYRRIFEKKCARTYEHVFTQYGSS